MCTDWLPDEGAAGFARCFCDSVFYCDHLEGLQGPNAAAAAAAALSRPTSHQPSRASLSGGLQGLSCVAGHVCSWRWRPRYANPPLRLRKVPFLPAQKGNNKEASVAAASGASAPTRRRPRVTERRFLLSIDPCMTLIPNQSPNFNPGKIQIDLSRIQGFQGNLESRNISCCHDDSCQ